MQQIMLQSGLRGDKWNYLLTNIPCHIGIDNSWFTTIPTLILNGFTSIASASLIASRANLLAE
jgi:hypothetical protein